jgi:putative glutamine amidotransferase
MKNILVSQRTDYIKNRKQFNDSIDQRLTDFIIKAGFRPILVPNNNYKIFLSWVNKFKYSGFLLSGGGDIGAKENINRDKIESHLIDLALKKKIPLFSICRGMQMLGYKLGIKLKRVKGHVGKRHKVFFGKKSIFVNSFHNYSLAKCPENFNVVSKSLDKNIESIIHKKLPIYGCMWHPEREKKFKVDDIKMFKKIFK